jgi:hypothetical protein
MTEQKLGHPEQALSWYHKAGRYGRTSGKIQDLDDMLPWNRRLTLQLLQKESQTLLGVKRQ